MGDEREPSTTLESGGLLILESCPDSAVLFDRNWAVVYANPTFQRRFSTQGPAEGTDFLSYLDAASAARLRDLQPQLLQGNRQIELNHVTAEPRTVSLQYSFFPAGGSGQEPLVAGIGRDRAGDLATLFETIQLNLELEEKQKELSEANARLEQLAITDQITELYNRHYFFQVSQHFWEEAKRYRLPLVVILMDIDNFKSVNDQNGHLFGDFVLKDGSRRLKKNTRKSDILARFGGEELIVLASNTDILTGQVLAERLRLSMASEPFVMGNCSAAVTISAGISGTELAEFPTFDALLDSSDQALYGAKRAGKNCVFTYAAPPQAEREFGGNP
jgi:diguanylate cyclase (GGDEF)-like protein